MARQVDTVFVWVTDLDESVVWYSNLDITPGPRYGAWQDMAVEGETRFALHQGDRPTGQSTAAVAFRVDNLDANIEHLAQLGIHPSDPEITDTGGARFTTYDDPDGNSIQLLERR